MTAPLSILIPTLNESAALLPTLAPLQPWRQQGVEVIVCDGGSEDGTAAMARHWADRILACAPGRARQMNTAAAEACGDYLLFLHADTRLPRDLPARWTHWRENAVPWGFFPVRLTGRHPLLRLVERGISVRSRLTGIGTGDQALFIRRALFTELGGFPALPLMEDLALCDRLRAQCPPSVEDAPVVTSSRRWEQQGIARTVLRMWWLRARYRLGAEPARLAAGYRQIR